MQQIKKSSYITILLLSVLSLAPFYLLSKLFRKLFWFGDEIHLLSQFRHQNVSDWLLTPFAESFVPLFKLLLGQITTGFNGSYYAFLTIVWFTHALTAFLLGVILLRAGLSLFSASFAVITFGLAWSNIETLGWAVQWSAILSITFFLIGWILLQQQYDKEARLSPWFLILYLLTLFCSTFSFARGILSCAVLATQAFLLSFQPRFKIQGRIISLVSLVPAIAVTLILFQTAGGNHQKLSSASTEIIERMFGYGAHVFFLNPLLHLFNIDFSANLIIYKLGLVKLVFIVLSFVFIKSREGRIALFCFLLFDLGNACLLGLGRYHEGLPAATSWRYQYVSLIGFSPFLAVVLERTISFVFVRKDLSLCVYALVLLSWIYNITNPWKARMEHWSGWRGREGRQALLKDNPAYRNWIGLPSVVSFDEGKETVRHFNLH